MIHPDEALALLAGFRKVPELETVDLAHALGRIMPAAVRGGLDQPPFDKAAMDGWAWHPADGETAPVTPLRNRGVIAAGSASIVDVRYADATSRTGDCTSGGASVTSGHSVVTSGHSVVTSGHSVVTSGHSVVTSGHSVVTSGHSTDTSRLSTDTSGRSVVTPRPSPDTSGPGTVTSRTGDGADAPLQPGETVRIMTGAPLPAGASRIQRFEWAETVDAAGNPDPAGSFVRFGKPESIDNIIRRGENARAGDELLSPRVLSAQDIAILAADGRPTVEVARRPVVGVLSTGTELATPGEALSGASIYDSNKPQILAQLASPAFDARDLGRLPDDFDATFAAVSSALATCDLLVLSGGVSMGDFDWVPRALAAAGVTERFHGVAMKPGKPTYFGTTGRAFVIGLPGNPVSVFVNTELLVKELLYALSGIQYRPLTVPVPVADGIRRKGADRVEFLPVRIDADGIRAVRYGGSSGIQALAVADGFARLEIGQEALEKGSITHVRLVR